MARALEEGAHVHSYCCWFQDETKANAATRKAEWLKALAVFGIEANSYGPPEKENPWDAYTEYKRKELVGFMEEIIRDDSINTVLLPVPSFHQEHQLVFDCGIAACRPTQYPNPITEVYAYEYPAANWGPSSNWSIMHGGTYIDISKHIGTKFRALKCHQSQMYAGANAQISIESVKALSRRRGIEAGVEYAELLYQLRRVA